MSLLERFFTVFTIITMLMARGILPACAQDAPTPNPSTLPKVDPVLKEFWSKERGDRILIAAPTGELHKQNNDAPPAPRNLREWVDTNSAVIRPFSGISAITNRTRSVMETKYSPPDLWNTGDQTVDRQNALPQLLATLTTAQWREIGSAQGLDYSTLARDQKVIWEHCLPNPFVYISFIEGQSVSSKRNLLTDAERHKIRLHIKLIGLAKLSRRDSDFEYGVRHFSFDPNGFDGVTNLVMGADPTAPSDDEVMYGQKTAHLEAAMPPILPTALEAVIADTVVNIPKRNKDQSFTMGEILSLIESATGVKLHIVAELRSSPITVITSGAVHASDLLRALLFAKDHAVRELPPLHPGETPLYVIARRKEPAGQDYVRWEEWIVASQNEELRIASDANARIAARNPLPLLHFDASDTMALSDENKKSVLSIAQRSIDETGSAGNARLSVPLSELSIEEQEEVKHGMTVFQARCGFSDPIQLQEDRILLDCSSVYSFVVPCVGEIEQGVIADGSDWLPHSDKETISAKGRILLVSAETADEAREWIAIAKQEKASEVWLQAKPEYIAAATTFADDIPVRAVVSVLRTAKEAPANLSRDEDIHGTRSRDWLQPDNQTTIAWVADRIHAAATIPHITGIVLRGSIPPGYRGSMDEDGMFNRDIGMEDGGSERLLGYSLMHRRAYVEKAGIDPMDITKAEYDNITNPWRSWQQAQMKPLWGAIRVAVGGTPLVMEGTALSNGKGDYDFPEMETFVPWDTKEPEPPFAALYRFAEKRYPVLSEKPFTFAVVVGNPYAELTAGQLTRTLKREDKPETTVWDLTYLSVPGVAEKIRALKQRLAGTDRNQESL